MDHKDGVFLRRLKRPSADGGWPIVDTGTFEDEGLWKI